MTRLTPNIPLCGKKFDNHRYTKKISISDTDRRTEMAVCSRCGLLWMETVFLHETTNDGGDTIKTRNAHETWVIPRREPKA